MPSASRTSRCPPRRRPCGAPCTRLPRRIAMHAFEYHRPSNVKDALALASRKEEGRYLAGGQSLVQAMKLRLSSPTDLIDLNAIGDLKALKTESGAVTIGAMVRHAEVAASSGVRKAIPALASLAGIIGDRQVRHMGTIGGSLANNDPAADYPAAVLGLGATIVTSKRRIEADKFFKGLYETVLEPGELITAVAFPVPKRAAYMKFKNPASRFARPTWRKRSRRSSRPSRSPASR